MATWNNVFELCDIVRETGYAIHTFLRNGHLEKVYENALVHRLRKQGLLVFQQHPLAVWDEDRTVLGEFFADLFIENILIVELKACPPHRGRTRGATAWLPPLLRESSTVCSLTSAHPTTPSRSIS